MGWEDIVAAALGAMEAKGKSDTTLRPKDQWYLNNPTSSNPFYNQNSSWNKGNPTLDQQMTPELQQVFDEVIWGALGEGRTPYGMNDNMGRLQNLQQNNQLGRYGQRGDPYTGKAEVGGRNSYEPVGVNGSENTSNFSAEPNYRADDSRSIDEIQRAMVGSNPTGNSPAGGQSGDQYNYGSGGIEEWLKNLLGIAVGTQSPLLGKELWDWSRNQNFWGGNHGMIAPDSPDFVPFSPQTTPQQPQGIMHPDSSDYVNPNQTGRGLSSGYNPTSGRPVGGGAPQRGNVPITNTGFGAGTTNAGGGGYKDAYELFMRRRT